VTCRATTRNASRKAEAKVAAQRLIREHGLPLKVVTVDHVLEPSSTSGRTTIYVTAPGWTGYCGPSAWRSWIGVTWTRARANDGPVPALQYGMRSQSQS
jgi:hypothetical protein